MVFNFIKNNKAQGLLESVIAIGVIVSGIVGSLSLSIQNETSLKDAKARLLAVNLAREGVEVVRNIRDTNWLSCQITEGSLLCNDWDDGLWQGTDVVAIPVFNPFSNSWTIDFTPGSINDDSARIWRRNTGSADKMGVHFNTWQVSPSDSMLTNYRRILQLHSICSDKTIDDDCGVGKTKIGIRVSSIVSWEENGKTSQIIAEERLFNWR